MKKPLVLLSSMTLVLGLLAGCGGSHDDPVIIEPPVQAPKTVPASATASSLALSSYVAGLPKDDSGEALELEGVQLPSSETDEPAELS
jgi:hypothetical protein